MDIQLDHSGALRGAPLHSVFPWVVLVCFLLGDLPAFSQTNDSLALRYARIYERELTGDKSGLVQDYSDLCAAARDVDKELTEKALYRLGVCEKRAGRLEQAHAAWRELVETFPLSDPVVSSARDSLKALEWEMDRVSIAGVVSIPPFWMKDGESRKSLIFAGDWGNEPPLVTDPDGRFKMVRRAAGKLPDGRRYGLIFAEHAVLPLLGTEVWVSPGTTGLVVALAAPSRLAGWVVDASGIPVVAARVRITGFKATPATPTGAESDAITQTIYTLPLPVDRLIPPVYTSSNGFFVVEDLPAGLRYDLIPEKPEYRVVMAVEPGPLGGANPPVSPPGSLTTLQLSNLFASIIWLRGNLETGAPYRWEELQQRVVVIHFGSAYGESSVRTQYPDEGGGLSRLLEIYGAQGVLCLWVLPDGEGRGEAAQLALGLYPDLPIGVIRKGPELGAAVQEGSLLDRGGLGGNVVMGRDGRILTRCSDLQLLKAVKKALGEH